MTSESIEKTKGIVIRVTEISDKDRLLTVLTEDSGKLTIMAKGASSYKSRFFGCSQMFAYCEFTCYIKKDYRWLKEASLINDYPSIRNDIDHISYALYFADVVNFVSVDKDPDVELFRVFMNTLSVVSSGKYSLVHIKSVFEIKVCSVSGFEPDIVSCSVCGSKDVEFLDIEGGVSICGDCLEKYKSDTFAAYAQPVYIRPEVLESIRFVCSSAGNYFAFSIDPLSEKELSMISEQYIRNQFDLNLKSLLFLHEVEDQLPTV